MLNSSSTMKDISNRREIENIQHLKDEYDLQKALLFDRKLRLMVEEDASLKPIQQKLFALIQAYEAEHWSDSNSISDHQVEEAENAESLVETERQFIRLNKTKIN